MSYGRIPQNKDYKVTLCAIGNFLITGTTANGPSIGMVLTGTELGFIMIDLL